MASVRFATGSVKSLHAAPPPPEPIPAQDPAEFLNSIVPALSRKPYPVVPSVSPQLM